MTISAPPWPTPSQHPTRGNAGFGLQVDGLGTNPGSGFLAGSTQPANQNLFGVRAGTPQGLAASNGQLLGIL